MQIQAKGSNPVIADTGQSPAAQEARARAIARLTSVAPPAAQPPQAAAPPAQREAVADPSKVSVEELSAVQPPSQIDTSEAPAPADASSEVTPPAAKEDPLSSQYANLARKEKALRAKAQAQEAALRAKEAEIAKREAAIAAKDAEYQSKYISKAALKDDPFSVLSDPELGLTYDELTRRAINAPKPEEIEQQRYMKRLETEIQKLNARLEQSDRTYKESQETSYKQAVNQIQSEVQKLVSSDPSFELIKETGSVGDVVELIKKTFEADGTLLSVDDAAREVEEYLTEEATKLSRLKKIQQRLSAQSQSPKNDSAAPAQKPDAKDASSQQRQIKTLTNASSSTRQLTAKERALLAFKGQLK